MLIALTVVAAYGFLLGVRLLRLAWRTHRLPELLVGQFFVLLAPSAYLYLVAQSSAAPGEHDLRLAAIGAYGVGLAWVTLLVFTYRTFRQGVPWAKVAVVAGALSVFGGIYFEAGGAALHADFDLRPARVLPRAICMAWSTYEAARCYRMGRIRLRFGLADPVVVNRFLLYALWTLPLALLPTLKTSLGVVERLGVDVGWRLPFLLLSILAGLVMFTAMFLNFYPPDAYLRWVRRENGPVTP